MKKLSIPQFISLLLLSRLFITMTYTPVGNENPLITITGGIISTVAELILILPALALTQKLPDKNPITAGYGISKGIGISLAVVYGLFFFAVAVRVLGDFSHFISFAFPVFSFESAIILSMAVAGGYIASLGLNPIARTAVITLFLFTIMLITVVLGSSGGIDITNLTLHSENTLTKIFHSAYQSLGRNSAIVLGIFLMQNIDKNKRTVFFSFIGIKYLVVAGIIFLYSSILGSYALTAQLPFFHLSTYSDTALVARFDPIFLIVWTLTGICCFSFFIWAAARIFGYLMPKVHHARLCPIMALGAFAVAGILLFFDAWTIAGRYFTTSISVIILTALIPLLLLLRRKDLKNEKN